MSSRIILPLDHLSWSESQTILEQTKGLVWGYKIRRSVLEHGLSVVRKIKKYGRVMLDFKLFDIPSAMTESLGRHIHAGADITTIHCSAGYTPDSDKVNCERIAGVTILTSVSQNEFNRYYRGGSISDMVRKMAKEAEPHFGYLVCSARELNLLQDLNIKKICPGIRPNWDHRKDDQHRTATPAAAISEGANLLVIGRPLLEAPDIADAIERTNAEIESALSQ